MASPEVSAVRGAERCAAPSPDRAALPGWARARRATVLVDSVLLGGFPALRAARPCWRVSMYGRPALMVRIAEQQLRARGRRVAPLVVVGLAYNSLWERRRHRHAYWAARFDRDARRLLRTLHRLGARQIVWVTLREPTRKTVPPRARSELGLYSWYFPYVNGRLRRPRSAPERRRAGQLEGRVGPAGPDIRLNSRKPDRRRPVGRHDLGRSEQGGQAPGTLVFRTLGARTGPPGPRTAGRLPAPSRAHLSRRSGPRARHGAARWCADFAMRGWRPRSSTSRASARRASTRTSWRNG